MSSSQGHSLSDCFFGTLAGLYESCCLCLGWNSPYRAQRFDSSDLTSPVIGSPEPPQRRPSPDQRSPEDDRLLPKGMASSSEHDSSASGPGHKRKGSASDSKASGLNLVANKLPSTLSLASDEDEQCPTCLEGYTAENPKIWTSCSHHYHLQCLLAWQNRSPTCPLCGTNITFDELL